MLEDTIKGLRVSKQGNIQFFLKEQLDTSLQEEFKKSIETLDNLTATYQANLDEFGDPAKYKNKNGNKAYLSPAIVVHEIGKEKSLEDMFANLES